MVIEPIIMKFVVLRNVFIFIFFFINLISNITDQLDLIFLVFFEAIFLLLFFLHIA